jgi:tetratricopeptide (TPR) repeat protein
MRQTIALAAIGLALLSGTTAAAQDAEAQARDLFKQGIDQFDQQNFEDALVAFQKADQLNPSWKLAFNIGQCQAALKRYGLAIEAFERYLAQGGDEVPDDRRSKVLDELSQFRKMVGGVKVVGQDDVVVVIDEIVRGSTPMNQPILVTAGVQHHIKLVKQEEVIKTLIETVRGESTLEIDLSDTAPAPAPAPIPAETDEGDEPAAVPEDESDGISPAWFWVGLGATAVFAGGAVGANFALKDLKDDDTGVVYDSDYDNAKALRIAGLASFGLAIAAGVTTGVLAFFTDWGGDDESPAEIQVGAFGTGESAGLSLQGSF